MSVNMPSKMKYTKHQVNKKAESCYEDSASNKKWYHQESNRGHKDFQSFALPTELWHHTLTDDFSFAGAKVQQLFGSTKFLSEKLFKKDKKVLFYLVLWRFWCTFAPSLYS